MEPIEDAEEAHRTVPKGHGRDDRGPRSYLPRRERVAREDIETLLAAGTQGRRRDRIRDRQPRVLETLHTRPGDSGDHELVAVEQRDLGRARVDQRTRALHDQLQHAVEIRDAAEREADLGRGLEAAHRALELVPAFAHRAVEASVGDRDRGPVGENDRSLLVVLGENAVVLLGQVQVSPGLTVDHDRHAQERRHRRMGEREAVGLRVHAHVRQPQRAGVADQHSKHAAPPRQVADRAVRLFVDPDGEEALEPLAAFVQHADRRVLGARQLTRNRQQPLKDRLGIEDRDQ